MAIDNKYIMIVHLNLLAIKKLDQIVLKTRN